MVLARFQTGDIKQVRIMASRLIVKNLPNDIKQEKLTEMFSTKGQITDCSLKYTKDGSFRNFAFIGYKTDSEAAAALDYYNKTYIGSKKIQVEICSSFGGDEMRKVWSKYAKGNTDKQIPCAQRIATQSVKKPEGIRKDEKRRKNSVSDETKSKKSKQSEELTPNKSSDTKLIDQKINNANKIVSDEEVDGESPPTSGEKISEKLISDKDYLLGKINKNIGTNSEQIKHLANKNVWNPANVIKLRGAPYGTKREDIVKFFAPLDIAGVKVPRTGKGGKMKSNLIVVRFGDNGTREKAMRRDKNLMGKRYIELLRAGESGGHCMGERGGKGAEESGGNVREHGEKTGESGLNTAEAVVDDVMELIVDSGRIFVRNLSYNCTEDEISQLFSPFGQLVEVNLPINFSTKVPMGFAFVTFMFPAAAQRAFEALDGSVFQGRMLHLLPGKPRRVSPTEAALSSEASSYKQRKAAALRLLAGNRFNWNSLFLGADAVAELMATRYDVSKSEVLDGSGSIGVRLALGESQLVKETRDWLESRGVVLDSFGNAAAPRSRRVVVVKNLGGPGGEAELRGLLRERGVERGAERVLVPPGGVTGLVEFGSDQLARRAYDRLVYAQLGGGRPVYLEWAPLGVFGLKGEGEGSGEGALEEAKAEGGNKVSKKAEKDVKVKVKNKVKVVMKPKESAVKEEDIVVSGDEELTRTPSKSETVEGKPAPENSREDSRSTTHMSVTAPAVFPESAPTLSSAPIPGSAPTVSTHHTDTGSTEGRVLYVKNLNFSTTEEQLREHFLRAGALRSVSVAKKKHLASGSFLPMGYGFLEYETPEGAKSALSTLQGSPLEGHALELKVSSRPSLLRPNSSRRLQKSREQKDCSKILVRNVPFEGTEKDIRELFQTFGLLRSVRLPKKLDATSGSKRHRGFAFVDFISKEDATKSFKALCFSTHLYGRRLVLEWADSVDDSLESIRSKTAERYMSAVPRKKLKQLIEEEVGE